MKRPLDNQFETLRKRLREAQGRWSFLLRADAPPGVVDPREPLPPLALEPARSAVSALAHQPRVVALNRLLQRWLPSERQRTPPPPPAASAAESPATLSSSAADAQRRVRRRRLHVQPPVSCAPLHSEAEMVAVPLPPVGPVSPALRIRSFAQLWQEFPQAAPVDQTEAAPTHARRVARRRRVLEADLPAEAVVAAVPDEPMPQYLVEQVTDAFNKLTLPDYSFVPLGPLGPQFRNQEVLWEALQARSADERVTLPVLRAEFEDELLQQAGTFPYVDPETGAPRELTYPPCRWGPQCMGQTVALPGLTEKVVFMALMFPQEYDLFVRTGQPPTQAPRPCLLCYRQHVLDFQTALQLTQPRVGGVRTGVLQLFANLCNEPGGYHHEDMLHPPATHFSGFVDPVVLFRPTRMRAFRDARQDRRWRLDQSLLKVQPAALQPTLRAPAVRLSHF